MATPWHDVFINLDRIICHEERDGLGNAEPYFWTLFFRIGGDDITLIHDATDLSADPPEVFIHLEGSPLLRFGPGSHGNLGTRDVRTGDTVSIPGDVGQFETTLKPIAVPDTLRNSGVIAGVEVPDDLPGVIGAVVVLMEEDNVSDDGAEAGHAALNNAIADALQNIIDTRTYENQGLDDVDIDGLVGDIPGQIASAIREQQRFFENVWSRINRDDQIGNAVFFFSSDDLDYQTPIPLQRRWTNKGDWEMVGELIPSYPCPADSFGWTLTSLFGSDRDFRYDREALIHFRDSEFVKRRRAFHWWELAKKNMAQIVSLMLHDSNVAGEMLGLFKSAQKLVRSPDARVPEEDIRRAVRVVSALRKSKKRRTRVDAARLLDLIHDCRGKTIREVLKLMDSRPPARYPARYR